MYHTRWAAPTRQNNILFSISPVSVHMLLSPGSLGGDRQTLTRVVSPRSSAPGGRPRCSTDGASAPAGEGTFTTEITIGREA